MEYLVQIRNQRIGLSEGLLAAKLLTKLNQTHLSQPYYLSNQNHSCTAQIHDIAYPQKYGGRPP